MFWWYLLLNDRLKDESFFGHTHILAPRKCCRAWKTCGFYFGNPQPGEIIQFDEHMLSNTLTPTRYSTQTIHGTGIFPYIYHKKSTIHVGKYYFKYIIHGWYGVCEKKKRTKTRLTSTPHPFPPNLSCFRGVGFNHQATGKRCDTTSTSRAGRKIRCKYTLED